MSQPARVSIFKGGGLIALKVRDFRLYWSGLVAQVMGQHMYQFSLGWLSLEGVRIPYPRVIAEPLQLLYLAAAVWALK